MKHRRSKISHLFHYLKSYSVLFLLLVCFFIVPSRASADVNDLCTGMGGVISEWRAVDTSGSVVKEGSGSFNNLFFESGQLGSFSINLGIDKINTSLDGEYIISVYGSESDGELIKIGGSSNSFGFPGARITLTHNNIFTWGAGREGKRVVYLYERGFVRDRGVCKLGEFDISDDSRPRCNVPIRVSRTNPDNPEQACYVDGGRSCVDPSHTLTIAGSGLVNGDKTPYQGPISIGYPFMATVANVSNGSFSTQVSGLEVGHYKTEVYVEAIAAQREFGGNCVVEFDVINNCASQGNACSTLPPGTTTAEDVNFDLCSQASKEPSASGGISPFQSCVECLSGASREVDKGAKDDPGYSPPAAGIWTAVGCIETKPQSIIKAVVEIGVGIAGGIALLMTLVGGFLLTTSQGDPKRTQEGKDMITASVIGIIFVLFSVVILQFIGVTIFRLPGFGS